LKIRAALLAPLFGVLIHACGSSSSSSMSSSADRIKCKSIDDCTGIADATACTSGYCVDATGARVSLTPASPSGNLSPCNPLSGPDGGSATIEYVADVEDGSVLVVTHPAGAGESTGIRAFYGQVPRLDERHVIDAELVMNGNGQLTFAVGMSTYTANFVWVTDSSADGGVTGHPDLGTVDEGSDVMPSLTVRWPTPAALPGYSFTCL
jgi:hypothetical protein